MVTRWRPEYDWVFTVSHLKAFCPEHRSILVLAFQVPTRALSLAPLSHTHTHAMGDRPIVRVRR